MFDKLSSWPNLLLAFGKAAKGKRGKAGVAAFEHRLEDNLLQLQRELRQRSYQPGGYVSFTIHDPKQRLISAAPFRDRVVHHALCNLIEPIFERSFVYDSYANRVGKGTHRGAHPRPVTEGIPFLGFVIYPEKRRLKRRKGVYYQRQLSRMREAYMKGEIDLEEMSASVRGWANHVRYANSVGLRKALFCQPIPPVNG